MTERIGAHFFGGKNRPSVGYEGRGFLAEGARVATETFIAELRVIATRASRFKVTARANVVGGTTNKHYSFFVQSNLRPAMTTWKTHLIEQAVAALEIAGRRGVRRALEVIEETDKGTETVGKVTDPIELTDNIDYDVVNSAGLWGVTIGTKKPSFKAIAQEMGLFDVRA